MKRFRNLLVWVDDDPHAPGALAQAAAVARLTGASLTLAHAVEPPGRLFRSLYPNADELHRVLQREWRTRLEELAAPLRAEGLATSTCLLEGRPFVAFVHQVQLGEHDLLVKAAVETEGDDAPDSTDMHVLRKSPCAVWLTSTARPTDERVLALVDPDPEDDGLGRRILEVASSLADQRGARLDVLHVWKADGESLLRGRLGADDLAKYVADTRESAVSELDDLLRGADLSLPEDRVHVLRGEVREAIPAFARRHRPDLLVLGTVSRSGVPGLLIGNTAESVLNRVRASVLAVKPSGFVSPLLPANVERASA